ncbi:MAG: helix-turn-helix domain-containing protein [Proteobacteria bacterium]|nr:helix-turn-helix domain-containing protein [Pseudomonadota bacterium]
MNKQTDTPHSENPHLDLAREFVEHTGHHVFLTGKAGTGKTTFLKTLKKNTAKRMIVTAPTGVAAINAGGVTLHSFFQLPFGPFIPGGGAYASNRDNLFRFSKKKKQIIKNLDLLVIDEISMVRADVLDAVDEVLRYHRRNTLPFGGVQLLMIGDLYQLSPVAKQDEWELLRQYYDSVYFFSSQGLSGLPLYTIELQKIYRQSDERFIRLLNRVRDNRLENTHIEELNLRYVENFTPTEGQGFITLTTHNRNADTINQSRLDLLKGEEHHLQAEVEGEFPPQTFPTLETLTLKINAQVMFLRNDSSFEKRYFNGKIGRVTAISPDKIRVHCPDDIDDIEVEPLVWENITYTVNEETKDIVEEIIGTFKQFPLKLAWAITIHKSQGLTFDNAVIDARAAFAHGQVYVALSRCKTLEGMVLSSPVPERGIDTDLAVSTFIDEVRSNPPTEDQLTAAKQGYQQQLLLECFDFQTLNHRLNALARILSGNAHLIKVSGVSDMNLLLDRAAQDIFSVSAKFKNQLSYHFPKTSLPESDDYIQERVCKASQWFQEKMDQVFDDFVNHMAVDTDNTDLSKTISRALGNLKQEIAVKHAAVQSCEQNFSPSRYLRRIARATSDMDELPSKAKKAQAPEYTESDIENPILFQELKEWRTHKAKEKSVAAFQILHQRVLIQIAVCLPDTPEALKKIKGMGKKTMESYGEDILTRVVAYRSKKGIEQVLLPEPKIKAPDKDHTEKPGPTPDSKQISFDLFEKGMTMDAIAKERGLAESTVHSHLCHFIKNGGLDINKLLSPEKQRAIEEKLAKTTQGPGSLKAIKAELGDDVSYGDIHMMKAHVRHVALKNE